MTRASPSIGVWVLLLGGAGFAAGFFGPIALNPEANQGPLLGIFITGPGGALLGVVMGLIFKWLPIAATQKWSVLFALSAVGTVTILFFCLPEPKALGYVIDGRIDSCAQPTTRMDRAIDHWEKRIAAVTWSPPRAGWKQDTRRMLRDEGVVVEIEAQQEARLLEHRKPWNRGKLTLSSWQPPREQRTYFANFDGSDCAQYLRDQESEVGYLYVANGQGSASWPPVELHLFLNLALIEPLPRAYRTIAE